MSSFTGMFLRVLVGQVAQRLSEISEPHRQTTVAKKYVSARLYLLVFFVTND